MPSGLLFVNTTGAFEEPPKNMAGVTSEALDWRVLKAVSSTIARLHHHNISTPCVNPAVQPTGKPL